MPAVKDVGEPCAGEPHARFDGRELETEQAMAADQGSPRETEGPEPGPTYSPSPRQLPTRPSSTDFQGGEVRVGKRTIATQLGKGTRASQGNYQHISEKLQNLASAGFISIGDTTREGTLYTVSVPDSVPSVRERKAASVVVEKELDYFTDPSLRDELMVRDGWKCRYCGEAVTSSTATLDHVVPQHLGGPNTADNLTTACLTCNSIKSGRTYEEAAPDILAAVVRRRSST